MSAGDFTPGAKWKVGNEFAPYHPQASHVNPDYRDGWNACFRAATGSPQAPEGDAPVGVIDDDGRAWAYSSPGGNFQLPSGTKLYTRPTPAGADEAAQRALIGEIEQEFVVLPDLPAWIRRLQDKLREARAALSAGAQPAAQMQDVDRAADFLEQYAGYIREVKPDDLERHPYLPELEEVARQLRALSAPPPPAPQGTVPHTCKHGVRAPHECRECEAEPSDAVIAVQRIHDYAEKACAQDDGHIFALSEIVALSRTALCADIPAIATPQGDAGGNTK